MPYISLLNYWKNHDIEGVTNMVDDQVAAYYFNDCGVPVALNKSVVIDMLHKRMKQVEADAHLQWNFEVVQRAHIQDKQIVIFYTYSSEKPEYHEIEKTMISIIFDTRQPDNVSRIISIHITPNIKDFHS
ncbi:hypothetical protein TP70_07285 [Staphylococcus microti]|uniref:Nuclear transport factor 2 family protein n=1 Tax=Staphylococcus microti TaxID=569857 RepID=A0A0D6XPD5_9STAP|nr:hypothetical protein [Staphylococcus microti]KIX90487.1 hypothetical protein TP70_07285 [Staphylococcus microti]PNZ83393.1 hypothetical protein CD132_02515 [Staphylococcus microti]SUM57950.1 Uncharacterised protein [Staphylococcus microti]